MFQIHGWPDNKEVYSNLISKFNDYRIVTFDLPHQANIRSDMSKYGYDLDSLSLMVQDTLKRSLDEINEKNAIIICHDWGSVIGLQLQRMHPEVVDKIIVLDVFEESRNKFMSQKSAISMIFLGFIYQYYLATAWILSLSIPLLGDFIGTNMTLIFLQFADVPESSLKYRPSRITARMNQLQFQFQVGNWLEIIGFKNSFDIRNNITKERLYLTDEKETTPVLFLQGADKGFNFHSEKTVEKLMKKGNGKVVGLTSKCNKKIGHWVQITDTENVYNIISDWLSNY